MVAIARVLRADRACDGAAGRAGAGLRASRRAGDRQLRLPQCARPAEYRQRRARHDRLAPPGRVRGGRWCQSRQARHGRGADALRPAGAGCRRRDVLLCGARLPVQRRELSGARRGARRRRNQRPVRDDAAERRDHRAELRQGRQDHGARRLPQQSLRRPARASGRRRAASPSATGSLPSPAPRAW